MGSELLYSLFEVRDCSYVAILILAFWHVVMIIANLVHREDTSLRVAVTLTFRLRQHESSFPATRILGTGASRSENAGEHEPRLEIRRRIKRTEIMI